MMNGSRILMWGFSALFLLPVSLFAQPWTAAEMDWPFWRGPEQNGISRETNLTDTIDPRNEESILWKSEALSARSTPIVMDGMIYVLKNDKQGTLEEVEKVVCADAATGEVIWENKFNVFLSDVPNTRVGWSSVVGDPATGNVFALGVCGVFRCIDGETGKTLWEHSLSEEYGLLSTYGGRTNFPIVYEDLVVISAVIIGWGEMAKPAHRFIAFDKRNGQPTWFEGTRLLPDDTTYSTPIITRLNGQTAMVFGSGDGGYHAFQLRTGKKMWSYNISERGVNTTPVIGDNGVVIGGHSEENNDSTTLGALFALDGTLTGDITKTGELWRNQGWTIGKTAPLIVDGRVYAIGDYGNLRVADVQTGQEIFSTKIGTQGRASPLYADGKLYVAEANGRLTIFKITEDGLDSVEAVRLRREEVLASPIVSHGRLYLTTTKSMYCFVKPDSTPATDPRPDPAPEVDDRSAGAATLQIVPAEAMIKPGQKQPFQVRLYSKNGLYIKTLPSAEVEFSVEGLGSIEEGKGKYLTSDEKSHYAAMVTAKHGELTSSARIRVVPDLPWSVDFSRGEIPETWVGLRYRNVHVDFDFLQKLKEADPVAAQLYIYLQSDFVNGGADSVSYDNASPRLLLRGMYTFLNIDDKVTSLDDAKEFLNKGLDRLVEEKFLESYSWENVEGKGATFKAKKGSRTDDGNVVMMKITTIPKGTRSQGWMGHTDFSQYTIQADVRGAVKEDKMPDIGVIAQRYRLEMLGASQELILYSWVAHEEKLKKIPFEWKPEVWYTMKLRADYEERDGGSVAVLKGKVWPRDAEEPAEWSITWEDAPANETGSPGLFGNAKDAEIFYDNILVTPNETAK